MNRRCIVLSLSTILLAGCLNYEQHVVLSEDASGSLTVHYSIAENVLSWMDGGNLSFTEESVREQYTGEGVDIRSIRITTEAEDSTRHVRVELEFSDIAKLSALRGFRNNDYRWLREGDVYRYIHAIAASSSSGDPSLDAFTLRYRCEFPGDIVESNADSLDGRAALWTFTLAELNSDQEMTALVHVESGGDVIWVLGVIGSVAALVLLIALLRRKR
jgi:hypothetical protein